MERAGNSKRQKVLAEERKGIVVTFITPSMRRSENCIQRGRGKSPLRYSRDAWSLGNNNALESRRSLLQWLPYCHVWNRIITLPRRRERTIKPEGTIIPENELHFPFLTIHGKRAKGVLHLCPRYQKVSNGAHEKRQERNVVVSLEKSQRCSYRLLFFSLCKKSSLPL